MTGGDVRVRFRGYVPERLPSGAVRHRVRVAGDPKRRIVIPVGPDDPAFSEHYHAARSGKPLAVSRAAVPQAGTLDALAADYLSWLTAQSDAGRVSPLTLKQRRSQLGTVCDVLDPQARRMGGLHSDLPAAAVLHIIDAWGSRTGAADNVRKTMAAMYAWAIPRNRAAVNPAAGVPRVHRSRGGAVPWSADDVRQFMARHGEGTTARLWLVLALLTGARIADLAILGRQHEVRRGGLTWLEWTPGKKGSAPAALPMAPQLIEATRGMTVQGAAYLLTARGRPFASSASLGNLVQDWTAQAGLERRTSHGVRKALGSLLGEMGCSELQIMSILTHTNPTTSSIYTKGAERRAMAAAAVQALEGVKLW